MIQVPVTQTGNSSVEVTLDGTTYKILTRYNNRNGRLYMSLFLNSRLILSGLRMIENYTSTDKYTDVLLPKGSLQVAQFRTVDEVATLGNTGVNLDYSLVYIPEEDIDDS